MKNGMRLALLGLLVTLVALAPVLPNLLDPRLPNTHEHFRYMLLSDWFLDALRAGSWYPRWVPEMNGGYGYPEFVFYQPGYFFVSAVMAFFTDSLFGRQLLSLGLIALVGGWGAYRLARCFVGPLAALLATVIFQITPYSHTTLYERGDLSEWMVLQWVTWPLYFLWRYLGYGQLPIRTRPGLWLGFALSSAAVFYSHPVSVIFFPVVAVVLACACLIADRDMRRQFVEFWGALALGLVLSAPYWLTVALMKPLVNTEAAMGAYFAAWDNTTPLRYLLLGSVMMPGASFNEREFLGLPFVLLSLAGAWFGRRSPLIFGAGLLYLCFFTLMTSWGKFFWHVYPFNLLQFPWRLAVFAPLLQLICLLGWRDAVAGMRRPRKAWFVGLTTASLVIWSLLGHQGFKPFEMFFGPASQAEFACLKSFAGVARPGTFMATLDAQEWVPRSALPGSLALPGRGDPPAPPCAPLLQHVDTLFRDRFGLAVFDPPALQTSSIEISDPAWRVVPTSTHSHHRIDVRLEGGSASSATINQLYLRGWLVMLDGKPIERHALERNLLPDGRMRIDLPAGSFHLQAWYEGPRGWQARNVLMLVSLFLALGYWAHRLNLRS